MYMYFVCASYLVLLPLTIRIPDTVCNADRAHVFRNSTLRKEVEELRSSNGTVEAQLREQIK